MKSRFIASAAVLLLASSAAMAKPYSYTLPGLNPDPINVLGQFSQSFEWTVGASGFTLGSLTVTGQPGLFDALTLTFYDATNPTVGTAFSYNDSTVNNITNQRSATFTDTVNGVTKFVLQANQSYEVVVTGTTTQSGASLALTGQYFKGATIGPVTPVPEPESYAMLLAGLGLVGTIVRRRKIA